MLLVQKSAACDIPTLLPIVSLVFRPTQNVHL